MSGWLILAAYVAGFLFTYRRAYVAIADSGHSYGHRDTEDRAMDAAMAMLIAMMWPATIVGYGIWRFMTPTTPKERKAALDAREQHIRELERELGIGGDE